MVKIVTESIRLSAKNRDWLRRMKIVFGLRSLNEALSLARAHLSDLFITSDFSKGIEKCRKNLRHLKVIQSVMEETIQDFEEKKRDSSSEEIQGIDVRLSSLLERKAKCEKLIEANTLLENAENVQVNQTGRD